MAALAGIVANMDMVGQRAVSLLASLLRSEQRGLPESATATFVEGHWHDGASAPCKAGLMKARQSDAGEDLLPCVSPVLRRGGEGVLR
jgi:hypothetical protein